MCCKLFSYIFAWYFLSTCLKCFYLLLLDTLCFISCVSRNFALSSLVCLARRNIFYAFPYINLKKSHVNIWVCRNTKDFLSLDTKYFQSLDTVYLKISICFVVVFSSLFHFILKQWNFPFYCFHRDSQKVTKYCLTSLFTVLKNPFLKYSRFKLTNFLWSFRYILSSA